MKFYGSVCESCDKVGDTRPHSTKWIAVQYCRPTNSHVPKTLNPTDFNDPQTFEVTKSNLHYLLILAAPLDKNGSDTSTFTSGVVLQASERERPQDGS